MKVITAFKLLAATALLLGSVSYSFAGPFLLKNCCAQENTCRHVDNQTTCSDTNPCTETGYTNCCTNACP